MAYPATFVTVAASRATRVTVLALIVAGQVALARGDETPTLEERAAAIEQDASGPDGYRLVVGYVSRTLQISVDTLRDERARTGLGSGELLVAHRLSRQSGLAFDEIVAEFRTGRTWSDIARDHHADLDRLSHDMQISQQTIEQQSENRGPRTDGPGSSADRPAPGRRGAGGGGRR